MTLPSEPVSFVEQQRGSGRARARVHIRLGRRDLTEKSVTLLASAA
jgi:hypothetical protein